MGCIPSKHSVAEDDSASSCFGKKSRSQQQQNPKSSRRCPPSPEIVGEPAPWVKGHAVLTQKEGHIIITERLEEKMIP
ncbi:hypothetical protein C8Q75DRAFT_777071 [Abortiporus biennis]|nr:hypothetical protein C8Q75DRAFT_777071 [Abortiporus biennis]